MRRNYCLALALIFSVCLPAFAVIPTVSEQQAEYERENKAVVRNKRFYKRGRFEFAGGAGMNPFDLVLSNQMFYGRVTWHISDRWSWEIANAFFGSPRETQYATDLVRVNGISNLQFTGIKLGVTSNLVWTPIYSKIRLWGATVLYFDGFGVIGGGLAQTQLFTFSSPGLNQPGVLSIGNAQMEPCVNLGLGFRFYFNRHFAFIFDFRNYLLYSTVYNQRTLRSNWMTNLMISATL